MWLWIAIGLAIIVGVAGLWWFAKRRPELQARPGKPRVHPKRFKRHADEREIGRR